MTESRAYVPEHPQQITPEWLGEVLDRPVLRVAQRDLGEGVGFMGDILHLDVEVGGDATPHESLQMVAKLPKKENRVMGEMLGVYEREIMFFDTFGAELPIRAPRKIYSFFDRDSGSEKQAEILALLDRLPRFMSGLITAVGRKVAGAKDRRYMLIIEYLNGFAPGDQLAGLDLKRAQQVLKAIAPLHRHFWGGDRLSGHFWLLPYDLDARMRHGIYLSSVSRYQKLLGDEVAPQLRWLEKHGVELVRAFCRDAPHTMMHCDLRLDNVLFGAEECAFIDFQLVRRGPAAYDVAYFVTSAVREDVSAVDRLGLLRAYHEALNTDYPFADLKRDYDRALMIVLAGLSSADDVETGNERGSAMMSAWRRRLVAAVRDIDPDTLLRS